jgi:hypothetical protein
MFPPLLLLLLTTLLFHIHHVQAVLTSNTSSLLTWWHSANSQNTTGTVADDTVRKSDLYYVQVSANTDPTYFYDSFVYLSVPANGMTDYLQYAANTASTQSWSSFLTSEDVIVRVTRPSVAVASDSVTIRPTNLLDEGFTLSYDDSDDISVYITIPYNANGWRFSVEFSDDLYTPVSGVANTEPQHSLLVFVSPMEDSSIVPVATNDANTFVATPGRVYDTNVTSASTVIFYPGVYWFSGTDHILLSESVTWIYFAPGAYVKGAVEFTSTASEVRATGHGVLSGEEYVWYADPSDGYQTSTSADNDGLRMWRGTNTDTQTFLLQGPTIANQPFNSMDWSGNLDGITVLASDYKQVGAFYQQTDGLEMYPGSVVQDVFYHSNDDTIKTYYSNVVAQRIVVWKLNVAPVIQFGWAPRCTSNVTVDTVDIIHQSYSNAQENPGLIGSDNNYAYAPGGLSDNHNTANTSLTTSGLTFSNIRAEGLSACLFRVYALENLASIHIQNVWIEEFQDSSLNTTESLLPAFYDATNGVLSAITDFVVEEFQVGDYVIWDDDSAVSVGLIDVDSVYSEVVTYSSS